MKCIKTEVFKNKSDIYALKSHVDVLHTEMSDVKKE